MRSMLNVWPPGELKMQPRRESVVPKKWIGPGAIKIPERSRTFRPCKNDDRCAEHEGVNDLDIYYFRTCSSIDFIANFRAPFRRGSANMPPRNMLLRKCCVRPLVHIVENSRALDEHDLQFLLILTIFNWDLVRLFCLNPNSMQSEPQSCICSRSSSKTSMKKLLKFLHSSVY